MPASDPIFINAAKFAEKVIRKDRNLIDEAIAAAGKGVSKAQAIKDYSGVMIRQILQMGKVDNRNPMEVLRKVGERLNLDDFLKQGEELPDVIKKLLGEEKNLKAEVLSTANQAIVHTTNKLMGDNLAKLGLKEGWLFNTKEEAIAKGYRNILESISSVFLKISSFHPKITSFFFES